MRYEEEEEERAKVREFLRKEVDGWDDPVKATAWFKGFSGQRRDWEGRYLFWRNLILKVARHLGTSIIRPSRLKNIWFCKDGAVSPLCLDRVLLEMYNARDLLRSSDLMDPRSGRLSFILWKAVQVIGISRPSAPDHFIEDYYILSPLLKEKALEVLKLISENHWTSSCVITMRNFLGICGGQEESSAVLSYLSGGGKAKYLVINKKDVIEGVKVSLSDGAVSGVTSLDYDLLHLVWTVEKLEQQLDIIDQRIQK
ncbi:hypothetical protein M9H77_05795 [Catharanthus roseus]|uniref:Uncharacterized protein n=1 Tax=Catharanthus roseus TaxID=4058 RepID=A0ACC0BQA5_CATRO|nr:hypothetical protein M9H77_05795 [Catharanthus roseus]